MKRLFEDQKYYVSLIHKEMARRGYKKNEIPRIIKKTAFMDILIEYPDEQMHYSAKDAVDEIIFAASRK